MSKFFITNNDVFFQKVKENVNSSVYQKAFENTAWGGCFALTTKKLTIDNENGAECDNGYAIVTGTMAWGDGEAINSSVLRKVFSTFDGDVNAIRKRSIGNYAAAIYKDDALYVFGEIAGFYNIYYYNKGGEWLVSNSLYDMAKVLKGRLTVDEENLTESVLQDGIMWGGTYYKEISRLNGFDYLKATKDELYREVEYHPYPLAKGSVEEQVKEYGRLSVMYAKEMLSAYGNATISMTGGLDARMVLAANLAAGAKPDIYYGTGNSFITNTHDKDREIDEIYCEKFDLNFHHVSWATPSPVDRYWGEFLDKYGFQYDLYAASDKIFDSISKTPGKLFLHGQVGELLRNLPWIEQRKTDYFTLEEYLNDFYVSDSIKKEVTLKDKYINHIRTKLNQICKYYQLDPYHINNEDIFFLSLERRKSADAVVVNCVNYIKYCSYQLVEYKHMLAARVPYKATENSKFMLQCLDTMFPAILDVPVFSHQTIREFHRDTMSLSPQVKEPSCYQIIREGLKKHMPWLASVIKLVRGKKNNWRFDIDASIYQQIQELYVRYDTYGVIKETNIVDTRKLVNYVQRIYALNNLKGETN